MKKFLPTRLMSQSARLSSLTYLFHPENIKIDSQRLKHEGMRTGVLLFPDSGVITYKHTPHRAEPVFAVNWFMKPTSNASQVQQNSTTQNEEKAKWNIEEYKSMIKTKWLSQTFVFSDLMKSTQTFTKENALLLPTGTMTVCNIQTGGRGRGNNKWESPQGCLLYSFTTSLHDTKVTYLPTMQYIVSMAVVDAILSLTHNQVQLQLKWPNDIYYNGLKIGGVLCESIYDMKNRQYVITSGVGLNVSNKKPTLCINDIIQQKANNEGLSEEHKNNESKLKALVLSREQVLSEFVNCFEPIYEDVAENGFATQKQKYLKYWMHTGQKIMVESDAKGMHTQSTSNKGHKEQVAMSIVGVSDQGQLLGRNEKGDLFELHPDGNSFDFFQGLVSRKATSV